MGTMIVPHGNAINRQRSPLWNCAWLHLRSVNVSVSVAIENCGDGSIVDLNKAVFIDAQVRLFVIPPHLGSHADSRQSHERIGTHNFDLHPVWHGRRDFLDDRLGVARLHTVSRTQMGGSQWQQGKQSNEKAHT